MSISRTCALALCLFALAAPAVHAQTTTPAPLPKFFIAGNVGYQVISEKYDSTRTFDAYEETATLSSTGELKSKPVYDASVGYLFTRNLGVSVGFTYYTQTEAAVVLARVPHPIFFDQVRTASYQADGIKNTTTAININAVYQIPFTTKVSFSVSGGPSIVKVNQDVVTAANLESETPPFSSPNISSITLTAVKKTTVGFNLGADAVYSFTPRYGAGVTIRYLIASADVEGLTDKLKVGGLQILAGIRVKF